MPKSGAPEGIDKICKALVCSRIILTYRENRLVVISDVAGLVF